MSTEVILRAGHEFGDSINDVSSQLHPAKVSPPPSLYCDRPRSPVPQCKRPATLVLGDSDGLETSGSMITSSTTSVSTLTSTTLDFNTMVGNSNVPEADPASLASMALERANTKVNLSILEKRMRIGKTKLGHTRYKHAERSFKAPAGNVINLQHEQYALTYGMMCGIRDSAGLQKPFKQRLTMDDFMLIDKKIFPANAQLQHPFKFKDYSPDVFRQVRRRFGIDLADYMLTLSGDFNFIEFMSNSKSGQFFFYSHDGRFMIKTQTKEESKFLRRILPHYYKFVMENPNTLITRFYGMHRVKMHHLRRKMHFVIMASVFDTPLEVHARFDLKGSRIGRHASVNEHERGSAGVMKDNDLLDKGFHLQLGVARQAIFLIQLRKDVDFLKQMKIMDYSLLIGVHDSGYELHDNLYTGAQKSDGSENVLQQEGGYISLPTLPAAPDPAILGNPTTRAFHSTSMPEDSNYVQPPPIPNIQTRLALSPPNTPTWSDECVDPKLDSDDDSDLDDSTSSEGGFSRTFGAAFGDFASPVNRSSAGSLPSTPRGIANMPPLSPRLLDTLAYAEYSESVFCKDDGGICGRDRHGRKNGFIYFLGIIDILQQYNTRKIAETFFKGLRHNRKQISAVDSEFYGDRFIEFIEKHVVQVDKPPSSSLNLNENSC